MVVWGGGVFFKTFLEGSVDRVIYRDYIVNRRFFIYCNLAFEPRRPGHSHVILVGGNHPTPTKLATGKCYTGAMPC